MLTVRARDPRCGRKMTRRLYPSRRSCRTPCRGRRRCSALQCDVTFTLSASQLTFHRLPVARAPATSRQTALTTMRRAIFFLRFSISILGVDVDAAAGHLRCHAASQVNDRLFFFCRKLTKPERERDELFFSSNKQTLVFHRGNLFSSNFFFTKTRYPKPCGLITTSLRADRRHEIIFQIKKKQ